MAVENPEHWPDEQRRFHLAYLDDPTAFPRRPVEVVWVTRPNTAWNLDVVTGRHEGVEITVTELEGDHRSLRFAAAADQVPPRQGGCVPGALVGDWGPNATFCVEVDGGVVWPGYNPEEVSLRAAGSARGTSREQAIRPSLPSLAGPEPMSARWLNLPRPVRAILMVSAAALWVAVGWAKGSRIGGHPVTWAGPPFYAAAIVIVLVVAWVMRGPRVPPSGS